MHAVILKHGKGGGVTPRSNPAGVLSESRALGDLMRRLQKAAAYIGRGGWDTDKDRQRADNAIVGIADAVALAETLQGQAKRGLHRNPLLGVLGNPPVAGTLSDRVYELRYRHAKDHRDYKHSFGPGVKAILLEDGRVVLWHPTKRLWKDFA